MKHVGSLAIGPANWAGQAKAWADAVETHLGLPSRSFAYSQSVLGRVRSNVVDRPDYLLPHPRVPLVPFRSIALRRTLEMVTHVGLDGYLSLRSPRADGDVMADVTWLNNSGRRVALIAHGSDVRDPDMHMALSPSSYFRSAPDDWVEAARRRSSVNRSTARNSGSLLFASTPDLLNDLPGATWLPLVTEVPQSGGPHPRRQWRRPLSILHLPSRRTPAIKGTSHIEPVLATLESSGLFRWVKVERLAHEEFLRLLQSTDVVIDQILGGSYGATTVEALAAGCIVVGNMEPHVTMHMPEIPPVVQTTPAGLQDALRSLSGKDPDWLDERSQLGRAFVSRWHDGTASAAALKGFLE